MLIKIPSSKVIPNADIGEFITKSFLQRSLQLSLGELIYPCIWYLNIDIFSPYFRGSRGGSAYFKAIVSVSFTTSSGKSMDAYSHLDISCGSEEYLWQPNHRGSYFCIDGGQCFESTCDIYSGNVSICAEGFGSHVPDEFKENATAIDWKQLKAPT